MQGVGKKRGESQGKDDTDGNPGSDPVRERNDGGDYDYYINQAIQGHRAQIALTIGVNDGWN
jgi:hypothetical protein